MGGAVLAGQHLGLGPSLEEGLGPAGPGLGCPAPLTPLLFPNRWSHRNPQTHRQPEAEIPRTVSPRARPDLCLSFNPRLTKTTIIPSPKPSRPPAPRSPSLPPAAQLPAMPSSGPGDTSSSALEREEDRKVSSWLCWEPSSPGRGGPASQSQGLRCAERWTAPRSLHTGPS